MKVLHVAEPSNGGTITVVQGLLDGQVDSYGEKHVRALLPQGHLCRPKVKGLIRTYSRRGRDPGSFWRLMASVRAAVREVEPDVVHLHSSFAGAFGRLALADFIMRGKVRVIYTPHAFSFMMDGARWRKWLFGRIENLLSCLCDRVVCTSRHEMDLGRRIAGLANRKVRLVYNGVAMGAPLPKVPRGKGQPLRLMFIGRFDRQKGFDILMEAVKKLPPEKYHLTAIGEPVRDSVPQRRLPHIAYAGWLDRSELPAHMAKADVVVVPSRWESFGLVAAEAQALGVPVLASDSTALPEIVRDGVTGRLFRSGDPDHLVEVLTSVSPDEWEKYADGAMEFARDHFTLQQMQEGYRQVYEEVCAES